MRKTIIIVIYNLIFIFTLVGQEKKGSISKLENIVETCIDGEFSAKNIEWDEIRKVFEQAFINGNISKKDDALANQYYDILEYFKEPTDDKPKFEDKSKAIKIKIYLGNDLESIYGCLLNQYEPNYSKSKSTSAFDNYGKAINALKVSGSLSPELISGAILFELNKSELQKELYQKLTAVLFFNSLYEISD